MNMPPLIREVAYDATKGDLTVKFQVGTYVYAKVPPAVGHEFVQAACGPADEALSQFQSKVEGKYASRRVET